MYARRRPNRVRYRTFSRGAASVRFGGAHMFRSNAARSIRFVTLVVLSGLLFTAAATATPASATPDPAAGSADLQTLMGMLSQGYSSANCTPVDVSGSRLAAVKCGHSSDPAGPTTAFFSLYSHPG